MPADARLVPATLLAWGAAAWLVGTSATTAATATVGALVLAGLAAVASRRGRRRAAAVALALLAVAGVAGSCTARLLDHERSPLAVAADRGVVATLDTTVARDARSFEHRGIEGTVVVLTVHRAQWRGERVGVRDRVTAFLDGSASDLLVGRRVVVKGRLEPATSTSEVALVDVQRRGPWSAGAWWWEGSSVVRAAVRTSTEHTGRDPAALVPALVDGDDAGLSDEVRTDFERAGLTHLLAVSGTNLTIVLAVVLGLARLAGGSPRVAMSLGLLSVVGFVLLARPDPSVLRAAAMGVVALAALGRGARGGLRAVAVAAITLLFLDPWLSRTAGFLLSCAATTGILLGTEPIARRLGRWLPRWAAVGIAVPTAAQLACTPIIAAISGEVSLVAVVANVLAAPAVAPTTVAGLAGGLMTLVAEPLGRPAGTLAGLGARWILAVGHHTAGADGATIVWPGPWWTLLVVVPLVALLAWWLAGRPGLLVGCLVGLGLVVVRPPQPGWPPPGWVMVACDVGQGDATVLRAGDGTAVVVDTGPDPALLDGCLRRLRVRAVPLVVLTHAHADHVDGWSALTDRHVRATLVGPTGGAPTPVRVQAARVGQRIQVGAVDLEVLGPVGASATPPRSREESGGEGSATNDASLVVRARVDGVRIMLTGDVEPTGQDALLRQGTDLAADVLKMPHHGSARQSPRFLAAVAPRLTTISAGRDNDYGHPAPAALRMLRALRTTIVRTDQQGDVAVVKTPAGLGVRTRQVPGSRPED